MPRYRLVLGRVAEDGFEAAIVRHGGIWGKLPYCSGWRALEGVLGLLLDGDVEAGLAMDGWRCCLRCGVWCSSS